jgi:GxxExxY protein
MPIHFAADVRPISEDVFKEIAYAVTGVAFDMHNEYGSLFAEKLFKYEFATECRKRRLAPVEVEVPISLTFDDFVKQYFADLLVGGGALFELKVVSALDDEHRAQTLNYLFLLALHRAKLINLGAMSVQHEFVSTTLSPADRRRLTIHRDRWRASGSPSVRFYELLIALLNEWGGFLQLPLYYEGLTHFFGGPDQVIREIAVIREGREVTRQKVHLPDPETAFKSTAVESPLGMMEEHLRRFLRHTKLRTIQWVNLHQHDVTFTTLTRS